MEGGKKCVEKRKVQETVKEPPALSLARFKLCVLESGWQGDRVAMARGTGHTYLSATQKPRHRESARAFVSLTWFVGPFSALAVHAVYAISLPDTRGPTAH